MPVLRLLLVLVLVFFALLYSCACALGEEDGQPIDQDAWIIKVDEEGNRVWDRTYGGIGSDLLYEVVQIEDGLVLAGSTSSSGSGKYDMWLIKVDEAGEVQWSRTYGGPSDDQAYDLVHTYDGGFALGGYTESYGVGGRDMWLVKTDKDGRTEWKQDYGGPNNETLHCIIETSDGGFVLIGFTHSEGAGGSDIWIVKTDQHGEIQWRNTYGGENDDKAFSGIQICDGYVLAGYTKSFGAGKADAWLVMTDEKGFVQWDKTYGDDGNDYVHDLVATIDGFALAGRKAVYNVGLNCSIGHWWLFKADKNGTLEWEQTYYGDPYHYGPIGDAVYALIQTSDDGFALAGQRGAFVEGYDADMWLLKTDKSGDHEWDRPPGTDYPNTARTLIKTHDGGYLYGGYKDIVPPKPSMPLTCPNLFPELWVEVSKTYPLAKSLIETARQKGIDPSIIDVMELEYTNAERARDTCDLEQAKIHLEWIIEAAAPEPYTLAAILLLPIHVAWRRRPSPTA